jgi:ureidoglycolate lyase
MKTIRYQALNHEDFRPFGDFVNLIDPDTDKFGTPPVEFYRDMIPLQIGPYGVASFSICRVEKRPNLVKAAEYHSVCQEGILPLDGDVAIHVAPASKGQIPLDKIKVFRVPQGTMVTLKAGVWHLAPYALDCDRVNVLIVLPERTYANDCKVAEIAAEDQVEILA